MIQIKAPDGYKIVSIKSEGKSPKANFYNLKLKPEMETIEVGADGEFSTDLTEEQEATARSRFSEAARGPQGKNPSTETPGEQSERTHKSEKAMRTKALEKKYPALSGSVYHSEGSKDAATDTAKELRKDGVHATIWHMEGPKSGDKSKYYVVVPESKKNAITIMPRPFTLAERTTRRVLLNSATFDKKSYEADGGDDWIHAKRELFFSADKAKDKDKWQKAKEASVSALGEERWQFVVWMYKKLGGGF